METLCYDINVPKMATLKGGFIMTNGKLLKEIAKAKQITLQELAEALGLTRQGLSKKIENRSEFRVSEVSKLAEILGLSEKQKQEIFFAM